MWALVGVLMAAGAALRIEQYLSNRSLWLDEALLVNNIVRRDYLELLEPLTGDQGAPVLFLWLQRSVILVGGNNELALRFVPLVAGLALLPVAYLLGRRLGSRVGGVGALALVAFSPSLVRYSTEVKQYSTDALLCTMAVLLAVDWVDRRSHRTLVALGLFGAVGLWFSHALMLVVAGIGVVLFIEAVVQRERRWINGLILIGVLWAVSTAAAYVVSLRDLRANDVLTSYWRTGYPPKDPSLWDLAAWLPDAFAGLGEDPGRLRWPALAAVVLAAGAWFVARHAGVTRLALVAIPFVAVLAAAAFRAYPFSGRLILFLVPTSAVLLAAGAVGRSWATAVIAPLLLIVTSSWWGDIGEMAADPVEIAEIRPVLQYVAEHRQPQDQVYVHGTAMAPYAYYAHRVGVAADMQTVWLDAQQCHPPSPLTPLAETATPGQRVWIVFAYTLSGRPENEAERVRQEFGEIGTQLDLVRAHDASGALYRIDEVVPSAPDAETRSADEDQRLACLGVRPAQPMPPSNLSSGPLGTGRQT